MKSALEDRDNPTSWATLFDAALPALDRVAVEHPQLCWTLGGGTALALKIAHRLSDDIDLFVPGVPLRAFTPARNPDAARISAQFQWPGHYLKFERTDGEVDFLSAPLQTVPGYSVEIFRGRPVNLETAEEIIAKKLRFRSAAFSFRDAFDLAAVAQVDPDALNIAFSETRDALPRVAGSIERLIERNLDSKALVRARSSFQPLLETCLATALSIVADAISDEDRPRASASDPSP